MLSRVLTRKEQAVLLAVAAALLVGSAAVFIRQPAPHPAPQTVAEAVSSAPVHAPPDAAAAPAEPAAAPPPISAPAHPPPSAPEAAPTPIAVDVRGEVAQPGVYEIPSDARLKDLLELAGGPTEAADLSDINLVAPLQDGSTLVIPVGSRRELVEDTLVLRRGQRARDLNPPQYTLSGWRNASPAPGEADGTPRPGSPAATGGLVDINRASQAELETLPGIGPHLASEIVTYRSHTPFTRPADLKEVSGIGEKRYADVEALITVGTP